MSTYYTQDRAWLTLKKKAQRFRRQVCQRAMAWLEVTNSIIRSENLETFPPQYYPLQASQEWKTDSINPSQSANLPVSTRIRFLLRSWIEYGALVLNMDGAKGKWGRQVVGEKAWVTEFLNDTLLLPDSLSNSIRGIKPHRGYFSLSPPFPGFSPTKAGDPAHLPGHCINTEHFTALFAVPGVHSDHLYQPKAGLPSTALPKYLPWMSAWNDLSLPGLFSTSCFWEDFVFCITHWSVLWLFGKHDLQN